MGPTGGRVTVVGSANLDLVTTVVALPRPGETVLATSYVELPGGKGSNQAVAAARMGADVRFVGLRGADAAGELLADALRAEGIDVAGFRTVDAPTGRALVMVDEAAENSIIVVGGANAAVTADHVDAAREAIQQAAVVVCQLEIPMAAVAAAARLARGTFVLNPAPAQQLSSDVLAAVDVLVVNETEFATVLGVPLPEDPRQIVRVLGEERPRVIIATLGARGAAVVQGDVVTVVTPAPVDVVDTTGAGDTFVGALAAELAAGSDLLLSARRAVTAASLSTRRLGATQGMPTRDEVLGMPGATEVPKESATMAASS